MSRYANLNKTKSHQTSFLISLKTNKKMKETLNSILQRIDLKASSRNLKYSNSLPGCLFPLRIRNQVLIINVLIITFVTILYITFQQMHMDMIMTMISDSSNEILQKQNINFQASSLVKYMDLWLLLFFNNNQALLFTNQIYNYALQSNYTIDMGVECPFESADEIYPSYYHIDMFCYNPQGVPDYQTYENSSINTNFVKFNSVLNMFILCYEFVNNTLAGIQINLNDSNQMVSTYPQSVGSAGYSPVNRPWYKFQENSYKKNITQTYYISPYIKYFAYSNNPPIFGEFQTLSLTTSGGEFHGVIQTQLRFAKLSKYFSNNNDVNIALLDQDGTILFQQTQINLSMLNRSQTYIYNQSKSGFDYLDWIHLTQIANTTKSTSINNTLFNQPIQLNIAKFQELPFYFTLFNNLTYEMKVQAIQLAIFQELNQIYYVTFIATLSTILLMLTICYFVIINILKPIRQIQEIIQGRQQNMQNLTSHQTFSTNILHILAIIITLKYSELSNLMFTKGQQCLQIEELQFPLKERRDKKNIPLNLIFLQNRQQPINIWLLDHLYSFASIQSEFNQESSEQRFQDVQGLSWK